MKLTLKAVQALAQSKFTAADVRKVNPRQDNLLSNYAAFHNGEPSIFFKCLKAAWQYFEDAPMPNQSFKIGIKTPGDTDYVSNGCRYATYAEASAAAKDLSWRWTSVTDYTVLTSTDPVNAAWVDGRTKHLEVAANAAA